MSFWDLIFGTKTEQKAVEPTIKLGRYSDAYKTKDQYDAWNLSMKNFDNEDYLEAYRAFFKYLRDDKEDNVRWLDENGGLRFEILQGSKRVSGFATAQQVKAEAHIARAQELSVAFMRRLMEANYTLEYSRYALDDDDNLMIKFDTSSLDGSPYKLYHAFKEIAVNADKLDDLLLDEFQSHLTPLDMGSKRELSEHEKEIKYKFLIDQIQAVFTEIDSRKLDPERYPSGVSYLLLALAYKIDFLVAPEGFIMETIEQMHRSYFLSDERTTLQKNNGIRKELEKILKRPKDLIFKELYATSSTFGIIGRKEHDTLVNAIDGELPNMDWYEENKHTAVALAVPAYIVGNSLFSYALPKPDRDFLSLYLRIFEPEFYAALNFPPPQYWDRQTGNFDQKAIKQAIRQITDSNKDKFAFLSPDLNVLDFSSPTRFARTYLIMVRNLDLTTKEF